jgi:hypothetical protein
MSKRRDIAKEAVEAQLKSVVALLRLYKEDFSKTPEDRERLQELVEQAQSLETLFVERTSPKSARP